MEQEPTPFLRKLMPPKKTDGETFGYYMITSGLLIITSGFGLNVKILIGIVLCVLGFKMTNKYGNGDETAPTFTETPNGKNTK